MAHIIEKVDLQQPKPERPPYHAPKLLIYGELSELTFGGITGDSEPNKGKGGQPPQKRA